MCGPHKLYIRRMLTVRKYISATRIAGKICNEYKHTFDKQFDSSERFQRLSTLLVWYMNLVIVGTKALLTWGDAP